MEYRTLAILAVVAYAAAMGSWLLAVDRSSGGSSNLDALRKLIASLRPGTMRISLVAASVYVTATSLLSYLVCGRHRDRLPGALHVVACVGARHRGAKDRLAPPSRIERMIRAS
jgi:hypothetical protein